VTPTGEKAGRLDFHNNQKLLFDFEAMKLDRLRYKLGEAYSIRTKRIYQVLAPPLRTEIFVVFFSTKAETRKKLKL
jgi:hypothetical protein